MSLNPARSKPAKALSLRLRLAGALGIVLLVVMVTLYAGATIYSKIAADRSYDRLLAGSALSIAETLSVVNGALQCDIPYAALDMLSAAPEDRVFYSVVGPDDEIVTGYEDLPRIINSNRAGRQSGETHFVTATYRGDRVRFAVMGRQISEPAASGWVWILVGQTRLAREELQRELVLGAIAPLALVTLLAPACVWFGIGRALRPLRTIGDELGARGAIELQPIRTPVPAELLALTSAIDGFMGRLAANTDTLRHFIAEAAHQLRTPLAALRAQAQVGLTGDTTEARRSLEAVDRNASKLSRLLDQLLSHATVLHRADIRATEPFDLIDVVHEATHETITFTANANIEIDHDIEAAPMIGDAVLIGESVKNILDNALRYGRGNGEPISIIVGADDDAFIVRVADRGPGIPADKREWVFDRFARGARNTTGAGLGLHIARQAVMRHGGAVTLMDRPGGGLIAEIRLPRSTR